MTFKQWMKQFKKDDSARGDLAKDILNDWMWPSENSREVGLNYLYEMEAGQEVIFIFNRCWDAYKKENS